MLAAFGILDDSGSMGRSWEKSATLGLGQYNTKLHQPCSSLCVGTSSLKKKLYLSRTQKMLRFTRYLREVQRFSTKLLINRRILK
jgi:hypothetical protein